MGFIYFILALLFLLIFIIIKSSILNLGLRFLSKNTVGIDRLILPIILSLFIFIGLFATTTIILNKLNMSIYTIILSIILQLKYSLKTLGYILSAYGTMLLFFLFIKGYLLKITIKTNNAKLDISKETINKIGEDNSPTIIKEKENLTYGQGLVISLFSFAIMFFAIILFIYLGKYLGNFLNNKYF